MDADVFVVFVQDVLKLVYVWNLNVVEHRNMFLKREECNLAVIWLNLT